MSRPDGSSRGRGRGRGQNQGRGRTNNGGRGRNGNHGNGRGGARSNDRPELSEEEQRLRDQYTAWKRLIQNLPVTDDVRTMGRVWTQALDILETSDKNSQQSLVRDLDEDDLQGRQHIGALMAHATTKDLTDSLLTNLVLPFVQVMTHNSVLDCLSLDTFVGGLYNYISGNNGTRAVPFFLSVANFLRKTFVNSRMVSSTMEKTLIAGTKMLREVLRRERRAKFHDSLAELVGLLDTITKAMGESHHSQGYYFMSNAIPQLQIFVENAANQLDNQNQPEVAPAPVLQSTYPREVFVPGGRHDNDHQDITKFSIFPTVGEIRHADADYIPFTDRDLPHFITDKAQRHIDTQFRLLRHDLFGEMKTALSELFSIAENDPTQLRTSRLSLGNTRAHLYPSASISYLSADNRNGLEIQVTFPQPQQLYGIGLESRRRWWEESSRLAEGSLLCLLAVANQKVVLLFLTAMKKRTDTKEPHGLAVHEHFATAFTTLAEFNQKTCEDLLDISLYREEGILIEFPGVLPGTFVPTLQSLQLMHGQNRFPFRDLVLPDRRLTQEPTEEATLSVGPPLYARHADFEFSLHAILKDDGTSGLVVNPGAHFDRRQKIEELKTKTTLDDGQCDALLGALTREFALIQGPPGTGKSHVGVQIMRVLQTCRNYADLGPIVVVCYTNHALDQFLEHLLEVGIERIIRIGGRSESEGLAGKNLRLVAQMEGKSKSESWLLAQSYQQLEQEIIMANRKLADLHALAKGHDWKALGYHITRRHPTIESQFTSVDEEGFTQVTKKRQHPFDLWKPHGASRLAPEVRQRIRTDEDFCSDIAAPILAKANRDVYSLNMEEREILVLYWSSTMLQWIRDLLFVSLKNIEKQQKFNTSIHAEVDRRVLQTAHVIGVTTSGMARSIAVLQRVRAKVVICEEAGEVMEPHMLSALLPDVQHFIQIGDHQQLRPQLNNFGLSMESSSKLAYQLDRSQFERLSVGEPNRPAFPLAQLNVNRRMRPEISKLVRNTIYPLLTDHETVKTYPDVVGMRKNVFWLDHRHFEEGGNKYDHKSHVKSKTNLWEVEMTHALVRHIIRQGAYESTDIAVLTPYTGQLQKLRTAMRQDFEIVLSDRDQETLVRDGFEDGDNIGNKAVNQVETMGQSVGHKSLKKKQLTEMLRLATVDNFQGEEAKIVIVSLVRSNKEQKVGFLRTKNRANVLLSRAKHGMYLIGNSETYASNDMWSEVLGMLRATDSVGQSFELACPRHPDTAIQVSEPEDFLNKSPEGGCKLPCDRRLNCGHECAAPCHSEAMHTVFKCDKPCQYVADCGHQCPKKCSDDCGKCVVKLNNVALPCGHTKDNVTCYQTLDTATIHCPVPTIKIAPVCLHSVEVACSQDMSADKFKCTVPCPQDLDCGHGKCPGNCSQCSNGKHQLCKKLCGRRSGTCNHTCPQLCHSGSACGSCERPCEVKCQHSKCEDKCSKPCAPCVEPCTWSCEHIGRCEAPCGAPCTRLPCDERCSKLLSCGHQCPSLCGETCPDGYCQKCSGRDDAVDLLEFKNYTEINVDETPIIVLGCGHFFTAESLDGMIGMSEVYISDVAGHFVGLRDPSALSLKVPSCPSCKCPVRQHVTQRYNRVINRAVLDEMSKRFLVTGQKDLALINHSIDTMETDLSKSCDEITLLQQAYARIPKNRTILTEIIHLMQDQDARARKLQNDVKRFCVQVAEQHHPAKKLYNATLVASRAKNEPLEARLEKLTVKDSGIELPRERLINLGGSVAGVRIAFLVLQVKQQIVKILKNIHGHEDLKDNEVTVTKLAMDLIERTQSVFKECKTNHLPRLAVQVAMYNAKAVKSYENLCYSSRTDTGTRSVPAHLDGAQAMLEDAKELCALGFVQSDIMLTAVEQSLKALRSQWYEEVSKDELKAVMAAMAGGTTPGRSGPVTWYECTKGHPFAIGECGRPMEEARCPECGSRVGGTDHTMVEGVRQMIV